MVEEEETRLSLKPKLYTKAGNEIARNIGPRALVQLEPPTPSWHPADAVPTNDEISRDSIMSMSDGDHLDSLPVSWLTKHFPHFTRMGSAALVVGILGPILDCYNHGIFFDIASL